MYLKVLFAVGFLFIVVGCSGNLEISPLSSLQSPGENQTQPGSTLAQRSLSSVASSSDGSTCAINGLGRLVCYGSDSYGNISGAAAAYTRPSPLAIDPAAQYLKVSVGSTDTCGITYSGVLKCWGLNEASGSGPSIVDPGFSYAQISVGSGFQCGVTTAGVLKCWGASQFGALGIGGNLFAGFISQSASAPQIVDAGVSYQQVAAANLSACGVTTTGILKCWGSLPLSALQSTQSTTSYYLTSQLVGSPTVIDSGTSYRQITVGEGGGTYCGILSTGDLKCWGLNDVGQIGDGTQIPSITPVLVDPGVKYVKLVSALGRASVMCGITDSGVLKCWGMSQYYGTATPAVPVLEPTAMDSGTTYIDIAVGSDGGANRIVTPGPGYIFICGVTSLGQLKCVGVNNLGQLGTGNYNTQYTFKLFSPFGS